jgi:hypothetical protein
MRKLALIFALALSSSACLAAAAAGAAGGIYLTSRGAESIVEGPIDQVTARAASVMADMNIVKDGESTEDGGDKRELRGKRGEVDVTIELDRESPTTTKVEVTARENVAEWDKEYAQEILRRIVERG